MSRIRSIKPEFWQDEKLARVPVAARLLFIGLWNIADDEGRLRGSPLFIRAQVFPYDADIDVEAALSQLANINCIDRFAVDGESYIQVCNFAKHQKIDVRRKSLLPAPPPRQSAPMRATKRRGAPISRRSAPENSLGAGRGEEQGEEQGAGADSAQAPASGPHPADLQAAWNELKAPEQPAWEEMPEGRKASAKARLTERPLEEWRVVIARIAKSSFARGLVSGRDGHPWVADPEFLLRPGSATKVLEGKYDDRIPRAAKPDVTRGMVRAQDVNQASFATAGVTDAL